MRLRFRDARCEYEDYSSFEVVDVTYTKTDKKAASTSAEENVGEETETDDFDDDYQEVLANLYSIRSSRKSKGNEETQNLTALAWEHYEDAAASSKVAGDSGLKVINTNESTQLLEIHTTPLPQVEAETFQSNYTSVTAEKDLFLASTSDGKPDIVFENRSQSSYAIDHSNMSAAEHLLSNGETQMEVAEEPLTNGKDSKFSSEEHQTESTGKGNDSINSKRKKRSSLATKFYSIQKMNALLNHVRNKNASFSDKTSAPHSMHHAENTTNITPVGDGQLPSDYDDELEEEEMKEENAMQAVNLTLELDVFVEGDKSNASSLSELELSKDKQADTFSLDHTLGNVRPNSSPAVVKNLLEASLPRTVKYSSKMTNEEWNLVSAKESLRLEANLDKSVSGKFHRGGRNGTLFLNKHMKKDDGFSGLMGGKRKGSHRHPTLKGKRGNKNDTLSSSGPLIRIRRKKQEYPKTAHLLSPRSKKSQKFPKPAAGFGRALFQIEANHTAPLCCTNTTEAPSEASHGGLPNHTLSPRQFKPSIVIGLPHGNGDYEYFSGEYYAEDTSGGEYEYHYVSFDDPYMTDPKLNIKEQRNPESIAEHYLRSRGNERRYYIAAKEVCWNYAGFKKRFG